jgi:hypothetical protein
VARNPLAIDGDKVVAEAEKYLGDDYVYGATGPDTFDCSGLVQYVFARLGVSLPRTSQEQYQTGTQITRDQLQPGDLVFSAGSDGTPSQPGHVAIYAGADQVIAAPHSGTQVRVQSLDSLDPTGYRRPDGLTPSTGDTGTTATQAGFSNPLGGLISLPSDVLNWFSSTTEELAQAAAFLKAFFQPSTYVRAGAGMFGVIFLAAGVVFLAKEARQ